MEGRTTILSIADMLVPPTPRATRLQCSPLILLYPLVNGDKHLASLHLLIPKRPPLVLGEADLATSNGG